MDCVSFCAVLCSCLFGQVTANPPQKKIDNADASDRVPKFETVVLRGKVVMLGPYLAENFDLPMDEDMGEAMVALVTPSRQVHPLIKDVRSRGFFMDARIRDRPMELLVQRYDGLPLVRLVDAHSFKNGQKHRVIYWCDICAIVTYEPGPCPCCQDEIELREQPVP